MGIGQILIKKAPTGASDDAARGTQTTLNRYDDFSESGPWLTRIKKTAGTAKSQALSILSVISGSTTLIAVLLVLWVLYEMRII